MKKMHFRIPFYDVSVTLIQVEGKADKEAVSKNREFRGLMKEWQERALDIIERECKDGGDTFRNLEKRSIFALFYQMSSEEKRISVYSHEKRHIEDRVLEFFGVDDVESAGLLAGYLGVQFYKFWKL